MLQASVILPARDDRERLARTLPCLAAQDEPPARVVVVDADSADGTRDWLRVRWPWVEHVRLPERDPPPAACLDAALERIDGDVTGFLAPGDLWSRDALAKVLAAAAAEPDAAAWSLPAGSAGAASNPPLSALFCRTDHLRRPAAGGATLAAEVLARLGERPRPARGGSAVRIAAPSPTQAASDLARWGEALTAASAGLGEPRTVLLVGLDAADRPAGLLDLLGHALALGARGRTAADAFTLADLDPDRIAKAAPGVPLVIAATGGFGPSEAAVQVCCEGLLRQARARPVRLALRRLAPSTLALSGRLVEAAARHPDLELWVTDRASRSYAASLLGPARVRLVPPGVAGLAGVLATLRGRYAGLVPALAPSQPLPLEKRFRDLDSWHAGFDREAAGRLGLVLARLAGAANLLRTPALLEAWSLVLPGWSALAAAETPLTTTSLDAALLAALGGRPCSLTPTEPGAAALCETWAGALGPAGLVLASARKQGAAPEGRAIEVER